MKKLIVVAAALLAFASFALAAGPSPAPQTTSLWKVSSGERTLYITGTTQLLSELDYPLPQPITDAFEKSQGLLLEGDPGAERKAIAALLERKGELPAGETLLEQLTTAQQKTLKQALATVNVPLAKINRLQPWLAALELAKAAFGQLGITPESSETEHFFTLAKKRDMPIHFLETATEQIRLFSGLSKSLQVQWLMLQAKDISNLLEGREEIVTAWRNGATDELVKLIQGSFVASPELYQALVTARNDAWQRALRRWLERSGPPLFVLVGIGNLVGDDGLIARLRADGYTVTQL